MKGPWGGDDNTEWHNYDQLVLKPNFLFSTSHVQSIFIMHVIMNKIII